MERRELGRGVAAVRRLTESLGEGRRVTADFLAARPRDARIVVFCHFDADGLAAGALFGRALPRLGFSDVVVLPSGRSESAFSPEARERLAALAPHGLVITDLGVHEAGVIPELPTLYVDHHQPAGTPGGAAVVSGYGWEPTPSSSWLAYELLAPLADVADLDWIAAVGAISDLGERAEWDRLPAIKKAHTATWLKEAVTLVNAARRASTFDVEPALRFLMEAGSPRAIGDDDTAGVHALRAARAEVSAELSAARRAAPSFATAGPWALLPMRSPCQIHPLIAQQWRGRLPKHVVIAANTGFLPGEIAFSARTARRDLNLPVLLRAALPDERSGRFGHGHDQASGGHLPRESFERLLRALGFGDEAIARVK